jgi:anti-anti-sigma factor
MNDFRPPGPGDDCDQYLTVRQVCQRADLSICVAVGEIDQFSVPELSAALDDAEQRHAKRVVVDLSQLDFLGVAGVAVLQAAAERAAAAGGAFGVVISAAHLRRAVTLTGAAGAFAVYDSLPEALRALSPALPSSSRPAKAGRAVPAGRPA